MVRSQGVSACMWGGAFKDVGESGKGLQSPGAQTPRHFPACEILGDQGEVQQTSPHRTRTSKINQEQRGSECPWETLGAAPKRNSPFYGHGLTSLQWHCPLFPSHLRPSHAPNYTSTGPPSSKQAIYPTSRELYAASFLVAVYYFSRWPLPLVSLVPQPPWTGLSVQTTLHSEGVRGFASQAQCQGAGTSSERKNQQPGSG